MKIIKYLGGAYAEKHELKDGSGILIIKKDEYGNEEYRYTQRFDEMGDIKEDHFDTMNKRQREEFGKNQIERI